MWTVTGFLHHYVFSWKGKQVFNTCAGLHHALLHRGQTVWKYITEAQNEMLPGWRQNKPGVWGANSILTLAHSIKATISERFDICQGHIFQGRIWPSVLMRSGGCYTTCKEHSWQKDLLYSLGKYKRGNPLSLCEAGKKYNAQFTKLYPDAKARLAMYCRSLSWWGWCNQSDHLFPQTNNILHGFKKKKKIPTLTIINGDAFVLSTHEYVCIESKNGK